MPVVQAFNALHAASCADKHSVSLQAMQVSVEEGDAFPLVAGPPPQHVMVQPALLVTKPSENTVIPQKGSSAAAGYDLFSAAEQDKAIVHSHLAVAVPHKTYDRMAPRRELAAKHHLAV